MAAADGTEGIFEPVVFGARPGLRSWLFFLDRVVRGVDGFPRFGCWRVGEPSREVCGEALVEMGGTAVDVS